MLLVLDQQPLTLPWTRKKERERMQNPLGSLCKEQLQSDSRNSRLGLRVSPDGAPVWVCRVLRQETSYSDLSYCLARSANAFIQKSCSFLNNVTAPIPYCILSLAGESGQGSCCPCTRSWCQLGPWHWGLKALSQPWEVLCQGRRWYHFRETSPLAQLSWWEKMALSLQGV